MPPRAGAAIGVKRKAGKARKRVGAPRVAAKRAAPVAAVAKTAPRAGRKRPAAKRVARVTPIAALSTMDPWANKAMVADSGEGLSLFITGPLQKTLQITSAHAGVYIYVCPSNSSSKRIFAWQSSGVAIMDAHLPIFTTADKPVSLRSQRSGIKLRFYTRNDAIEGIVRCLKMSQPLEFEWASPGANFNISAAMITELQGTLDNHPGVTTLSAHELQTEKLWVALPATRSGYQAYREYDATTSYADHQAALDLAQKNMTLESYLFKVEHVGTNQELSMSYLEQDCCRYPTQSLLQSLAQNSPLESTAGRFQRMTSIAQAIGSHGVPPIDSHARFAGVLAEGGIM